MKNKNNNLRRPEGKILTPLKSIRKQCIECMGGSAEEVKRCTARKCWLYPYRLGRDPKREGRERTPAQKEVDKRNAERLRNRKGSLPLKGKEPHKTTNGHEPDTNHDGAILKP
jgi:hypothetical protein